MNSNDLLGTFSRVLQMNYTLKKTGNASESCPHIVENKRTLTGSLTLRNVS